MAVCKKVLENVIETMKEIQGKLLDNLDSFIEGKDLV